MSKDEIAVQLLALVEFSNASQNRKISISLRAVSVSFTHKFELTKQKPSCARPVPRNRKENDHTKPSLNLRISKGLKSNGLRP